MTLYDADTGEAIGPATPAQIAASEEANVFLIDRDGDVIDDSQAGDPWLAPVRKVWAS